MAEEKEDSLPDRVRRVNRGGGWFNSARYCRSAYRDWDSPDARYDYLGFRVVAKEGKTDGKQD